MALLSDVVNDVTHMLSNSDGATLVEVTHVSKSDLGYFQKAFSEYFIRTEAVVSAKDRSVSYNIHVSNMPRGDQHA